MKETPTNWTENRNEVKNKVIEFLSSTYNLEYKDWEIVLSAIDSVFFYEDELLEDNSQETKSPVFSQIASDSSLDTFHSNVKNEFKKDYAKTMENEQ